jgi:hypothetical protein
VERFRRLITYGLLLVFGLLLSRSFLPTSFAGQTENCDEFAHIHKYSAHSPQTPHNASFLKPFESSARQQDEGCHSGQILSQVLILPVREVIRLAATPGSRFDLVFSIENTHANPVLEPRRRPPRASLLS